MPWVVGCKCCSLVFNDVGEWDEHNMKYHDYMASYTRFEVKPLPPLPEPCPVPFEALLTPKDYEWCLGEHILLDDCLNQELYDEFLKQRKRLGWPTNGGRRCN